MKATATVEVPNDFVKGQCCRCGFIGERHKCYLMNKIVPAFNPNCPLEIQENTKRDCYTCVFNDRPPYEFPCTVCTH